MNYKVNLVCFNVAYSGVYDLVTGHRLGANTLTHRRTTGDIHKYTMKFMGHCDDIPSHVDIPGLHITRDKLWQVTTGQDHGLSSNYKRYGVKI